VSEVESSRKTFDMSLDRVTHRRTATDLVSASLRRSILTGELAGGTRLGLTDIASIFDVSTTPVREALRQLSFEGLVTLDDYRGGVVTVVSRSEVEEIVRIRQVLEPLAIEEAIAGMTDQILDEAEGILEKMTASDTWDAWIHGNRAFHQKIYEAASSRRLVSLIKGLQDMTVVFVSSTLSRSPQLEATATSDHRDILRAARERDAQTLIEVTLRHLTIPVRD
jgi:DNA-binding GntR family transcriptional regulator